MGSRTPSFFGKSRILIVEDEFLIAEMIKDIVEESGWEVVGPFGTVSEAVEACQTLYVDAAIVDLVLHGEYAYPIADILTKRGIPFGFASGRETVATESAWEQHPFLGKPFAEEEVRQFVDGLLRRP